MCWRWYTAAVRLVPWFPIAAFGVTGHTGRMAAEVVFKVVLRHDDEGYSAECPALPGCWSQGRDEGDALDNIADAIREYLASIDDELSSEDVVREVRIAV